MIATLATGSYTAIVRGANNATGVAIVEVYDLDSGTPTARLGNISTRGHVLTDDNVMIGGFIIRGDVPKRVIIRVTRSVPQSQRRSARGPADGSDA